MNISGADRTRLIQARLDSLAAKHLYQSRIATLNRASTLVDYLAVAIPILYFPIRYLAKGTPSHDALEAFWEVLAAVLIATGLLKVFYRWVEKSNNHALAQGENMKIADEIQTILSVDAPITETRLAVIRLAASRQDIDDQGELGTLRLKERQRAYREALKELIPGDTSITCPVCHISPWHFRPGSCSACGNTVRSTS